MPYTLGKVFVWFLLAALIGAVIGWLLRSLRPNRGASVSAGPDIAELDRLRARVANLEPVVQDRDRLKAELAECRSKTVAAAPAAAFAGVSMDDHGSVVAERDALQARLAAHEATIADQSATISNHEATIAATHGQVTEMRGLLDAQAAGPAAPDVSGATEVLGGAIRLDDLKVVEGIGPKIEELCHAKGINTWWGLSNTDATVLRSMLDEAGSRFQMHDPTTWPSQAGMLARGQWREFKVFTDSLDGGRAE